MIARWHWSCDRLHIEPVGGVGGATQVDPRLRRCGKVPGQHGRAQIGCGRRQPVVHTHIQDRHGFRPGATAGAGCLARRDLPVDTATEAQALAINRFKARAADIAREKTQYAKLVNELKLAKD